MNAHLSPPVIPVKSHATQLIKARTSASACTKPLFQELLSSTLDDCAKAVDASYERLHAAASSAGELLVMSGNGGMRGDTADDLSIALAVHGHLLRQFQIKVKTAHLVAIYTASADSSYSAYTAAADDQGDMPCSITVMRAARPGDALLL